VCFFALAAPLSTSIVPLNFAKRRLFDPKAAVTTAFVSNKVMPSGTRETRGLLLGQPGWLPSAIISSLFNRVIKRFTSGGVVLWIPDVDRVDRGGIFVVYYQSTFF
jgi:hypothetical protein